MDVLDGLWLELRRVKRRLLLVIAAWVYLLGLSLYGVWLQARTPNTLNLTAHALVWGSLVVSQFLRGHQKRLQAYGDEVGRQVRQHLTRSEGEQG